MRPLWADFVIATLNFWAVLLPLEFAGGSALFVAAVAAGGALALLLMHRWRRRTWDKGGTPPVGQRAGISPEPTLNASQRARLNS